MEKGRKISSERGHKEEDNINRSNYTLRSQIPVRRMEMMRSLENYGQQMR